MIKLFTRFKLKLFKYIMSNSKIYGKVRFQKINSYTQYMVILIILLILSIIFISIKFSYKILLIFYSLLNVYMLYFFLFYYPYERKRNIRYMNKILQEKKEEYIKELNEEKIKLNINNIKLLTLKDDFDYDIYSWDIENKYSIVIGKKSEKNSDIDIDLSNHEYSHLVSRIHGLLNKVDEKWYYEDLGSKNGSGIERKNKIKEKLVANKSYLVEAGDIIYIGVIKILVN
ncbi:FHA domain-containing protein [Streptobacillus moniliformis]|uniref:FHA domain containing protein n=4 Tax=Streptobacillus moniliformis TaxID=34105 RepID=D1AXQ8_STRM9|nr:FHA domain-containing protein [Streptobacillus moniliformis]ACZ01084.1 FHA domain containing protein [Streptobacillus moniliformis DSM 12112]AVL42550.1 FHA domain-containing protein [Streptobacillus moniliformis]SQA13774.1 FHA domain [Streptobacillus moniliformis]